MSNHKKFLLFSAGFAFLFISFGFQGSVESINEEELREKIVSEITSDIKFWGAVALAVVAVGYAVFMQTWGIAKMVRAKLSDAESKAIIKKQIDEYFTEKRLESETEKAKIRAKKFYVISPDVESNKWIDAYLKKEGFVNAVATVSALSEAPATNNLVVFNNQKGDLKEDIIVKVIQENPSAEFFYFNMTGKQWHNNSAPILKWANNFDTLSGHLTNALKNNNYGF